MRDLTEWKVRDRLRTLEDTARDDIWEHRRRDVAAGLEVSDDDAPGLSLVDVPPEPETEAMRARRRKREAAVQRVLEQIPKVMEAAESGDAWAAADAALDLLARVSEINMKDRENILIGRKQRQTGSRGGVGKRGKVHRTHRGMKRERPDNATLCEAVAALRQGKRAWSKACEIVADRFGMSQRQMQRITKPVKW